MEHSHANAIWAKDKQLTVAIEHFAPVHQEGEPIVEQGVVAVLRRCSLINDFDTVSATKQCTIQAMKDAHVVKRVKLSQPEL